MRSLRLLLSLLFSVTFASFLLYLSVSTSLDEDSDPEQPDQSRHRLRSYFFFHSPASLFTPAATISLTDDNSTFFAARPAAFGPQLPSRGLSGQLWVGSGFGDDNFNRQGLLAGVEGELGCSDIPGWSNHNWRLVDEIFETAVVPEKSKRDFPIDAIQDGGLSAYQEPVEIATPTPEDGTDNHFHYPLAGTSILKRNSNAKSSRGSSLGNADIQSLQESAEIAGKIVILSRGGCGFSEKVKWAQRRGATAVVVGDNVLGGALVRMYASGDTTNITIPSLFTSHMSAHLLSSLIPKSHSSRPLSSPDLGWSSPLAKEFSRTREGGISVTSGTKSSVFSPSGRGSYDDVPVYSTSSADERAARFDHRSSSLPIDYEDAGWIKSSLSAVGLRKRSSKGSSDQSNQRPPSSGELSWSHQVEQVDTRTDDNLLSATSSQHADDFVIGVQDWRDPDIVNGRTGSVGITTLLSAPAATPSVGFYGAGNALKGGSITPGSGEYEKPTSPLKDTSVVSSGHREGDETDELRQATEVDLPYDWLSKTRHSDLKSGKVPDVIPASKANTNGGSANVQQNFGETLYSSARIPVLSEGTGRTGLWVTLTPTDMSATPFLNTLFVLVISPLITLAIVYSMLLLRSRIRRRRWRAPKSVVDRLPVHVYHRLSRSNSILAPEVLSQAPSTAATPLLAPCRSADIPAGPRLQPADGTSTSLPSTSQYGSMEATSTDAEKEKVNAGLTEWRRKYKNKQVECVVCLEEYIDGVSKVMSLPCGHEFHVDCITPWLTTRRRTCPICKGDVVRSMGRTVSSGRIAAANDMTQDEVQEQAAENTDSTPSSALPVPQQIDLDSEVDVEEARTEPPPEDEHGPSWISRNIGRSLGYLGRAGGQDRTRSSTDGT